MSSSPTALTSTTPSSTSCSSRTDTLPAASVPGETDTLPAASVPGGTDTLPAASVPGGTDTLPAASVPGAPAAAGGAGTADAAGTVSAAGAVALAVIACGALAGHVRQIAADRGWPVQVHALPALLHNRPGQIAPAVCELAVQLQQRGLRVAVAYADCGSYGALDEVCARLGLSRLPGLHCYDVLGGAERIRALLGAEPGTYLLTDFLVRSFRRSVLAELGLDRYPQLWPDYFGHYRRVVWLAQSRDDSLQRQAAKVAAMFGLPLTVVDVGTGGLERELERLVRDADGPPCVMVEEKPPPAPQILHDRAMARLRTGEPRGRP